VKSQLSSFYLILYLLNIDGKLLVITFILFFISGFLITIV